MVLILKFTSKLAKKIKRTRQRNSPVKSNAEEVLKELKNNEKSRCNYFGMHPIK
jgi:uncharacterized protein with GYD domain